MGRRPLPRGLARVVWRQAADIVARLLRADGARRGGASVKSLTLRDEIAAKKATHAVVCECLKHVPLLREVLDDARVPLTEDAEEDGDEEEEEEEEEEERRRARGGGADATSSRDADADDERTRRRGVPRSAAYVLTYELLFGAGLPDDAEEEEEEATRRRRPPDVVADVVAARATLIAGYRDALTRSLRTRLRRAKASSVEAYLRALPGGDLVASVPTHSRHARVNVLKISVADAMKRLSRLSPALGAFEYHAGPRTTALAS
jgi:putative methyltransferase